MSALSVRLFRVARVQDQSEGGGGPDPAFCDPARVALWRSIGAGIPYGISDCDAEGGVEHLSPSFLALVGMSDEEVRRFGWTGRLRQSRQVSAPTGPPGPPGGR